MTPAARLAIKVQPGARTTGPVSFQDGVLRLRVTAPAEKGEATKAALALTAELLGLPKSRVTLVRGATSREKLVALEGMTQAQVRQRLVDGLPHQPANDLQDNDRRQR